MNLAVIRLIHEHVVGRPPGRREPSINPGRRQPWAGVSVRRLTRASKGNLSERYG